MSEADAFCNGKQRINNPNMMRDMVNRTKLKGFMGSFFVDGTERMDSLPQIYSMSLCEMELEATEMDVNVCIVFPN